MSGKLPHKLGTNIRKFSCIIAKNNDYFPDFLRLSSSHNIWQFSAKYYLFPFARLCVLHNISQFLMSVAPPLLHAVTWSASISFKLQILVLLESCPMAQSEQFEIPFSSASEVCLV